MTVDFCPPTVCTEVQNIELCHSDQSEKSEL